MPAPLPNRGLEVHERKFARSLQPASVTKAAQRWQALGAAVAASVLGLLATGCPEAADLDNAGQYQAPSGVAGSPSTAGSSSGGSASSGGGTGGSAASSCETACVTKIFSGSAASCKLCHAKAGLMSSGLDLESPNVGSRLRGAAAKHMDIVAPSPMNCPTGDKLIDPDTPANSWLLKKVAGPVTCGDRMPSGSPLSADDIGCIDTFVKCVAAGM